MTILKDLCVYLLLYQSLYDLPNPTVCSLKLVLVLTNALGRNLTSVLGLTNPLGRRLISALVLTCHLKCQAILLILLCLAAPFFNSPRLFLFSISLIFVSNHPLLKYYNIGRNAHKDGPQTEIEAYTEATHGSSSEIITCIV